MSRDQVLQRAFSQTLLGNKRGSCCVVMLSYLLDFGSDSTSTLRSRRLVTATPSTQVNKRHIKMRQSVHHITTSTKCH